MSTHTKPSKITTKATKARRALVSDQKESFSHVQKARKVHLVESTPTSLKLAWAVPRGFYEGYVVRLIEDGTSNETNEVELSRKELSHRFKNLRPCTLYALQVAVRGRVLSPFTCLNVATAPLPPRNIKLATTTATTATLVWDSPDPNTNMDLYLYSVMCVHAGVADESTASVGSTMTTYTVYTLPINGGEYAVEVKAVKHDAVSKSIKMNFSMEKIECQVDIVFVIDAGMGHMATVKTIISELVTWPQIAESDVRVAIINFNDAGDEATVYLPLNAYYGKDVVKKLEDMPFCEESPFGTTAALWTMYNMLRETREAEKAAKKAVQGEGEEGEDKGEHPEQAEDKGEDAKEGDADDKIEQAEEDIDKNDTDQYAIVITEAVDNIKDCLALKRESDSQDENVKIFAIGVGGFESSLAIGNLKKLASKPAKQFAFLLDDDDEDADGVKNRMAVIRNQIINKMCEKQREDEENLAVQSDAEEEPGFNPAPSSHEVMGTTQKDPADDHDDGRRRSSSAHDTMSDWKLALGTYSDPDLNEDREQDICNQEDPMLIGRSSVGDLINILRTPLVDIECTMSGAGLTQTDKLGLTPDVTPLPTPLPDRATSDTENTAGKDSAENVWSHALG